MHSDLLLADERKQPSPPNKKRYEQAMETLAAAISNKEADLAAHVSTLMVYLFSPSWHAVNLGDRPVFLLPAVFIVISLSQNLFDIDAKNDVL